MIGVTVDRFTFNLVAKRIKTARENLIKDMLTGVDTAVGVLNVEVGDRIGFDTGALSDSRWNGLTDIRPGEHIVSGKVSMQAPGKQQLPYAWMEEEGGTIVPKPTNKRGLLFWRDRETGEFRSARRVYHTGKHYMRDSMAAKQDECKRIILGSINGIFDVE
jgi:hypothetical protein